MKWKPIVTRRRCVALDINGKRCRKCAAWRGGYRGNDEESLYHDVYPKWVLVELCNVHASGLR